ncbi:MAG: flagellar basal body-associated FliL family protein [Azoarcus sp.]|jgi:flagellar FliL protein|nr:flagellar basal body-associated FliL family protein [Azoarcus sp.]
MAQQAATKTPAKPETTAAEAAPPKPRRGGKVLLIIVLILVTVLLLAVLGISALLLLRKSGGNSGHDAAAELAAAQQVVVQPPTVDLTKPPVFAPLDPFTVNLRSAEGEDSHYLQAVIALRVADQATAEALKGWMPEIRHRINMLMSAKLASEVQDIKGREALAQEIHDQLNTLLGVPPPPPDTQSLAVGPIRAVLFSSFIVQ